MKGQNQSGGGDSCLNSLHISEHVTWVRNKEVLSKTTIEILHFQPKISGNYKKSMHCLCEDVQRFLQFYRQCSNRDKELMKFWPSQYRDVPRQVDAILTNSMGERSVFTLYGISFSISDIQNWPKCLWPTGEMCCYTSQMGIPKLIKYGP